MSAGTETRPLLPQQYGNGMQQNYSFAPPNMGVGADKKNFVFVDEHNRHKRLKVMRACEGCRRRKIKCDAVTTNQWPCASCVRLRANCMPPTISHDRTHGGGSQLQGLERVLDFDQSDGSGEDDYNFEAGTSQLFDLQNASTHTQGPYSAGLGPFSTPPFSEKAYSQHELGYDEVQPMPLQASDSLYNAQDVYYPPHNASLPTDGVSIWNNEHINATDLSNLMGGLGIANDGVASYISNQKKALADTPAYEDVEIRLPETKPFGTVRIPQALMPSKERCLELFELFFQQVHPYVPVLSKPYFYEQWRHKPESISPLILEAIFACAGSVSSDDDAEGAQWLALAAKHEDCFMDTPRLSTLQAMLLLLKGREAAPKRGYYFRSWMTVKKLVTFALELKLDKHYSEHQVPGGTCTSDLTECFIKTRLWQIIFACEMMIGGPQGRRDMQVQPSTVDLTVLKPTPGLDNSDYRTSRQFTFLVSMIQTVRRMHDIKEACTTNDWMSDPNFVALETKLAQWVDGLPRDLQIDWPKDDSPPWLPSHFVGNMHTYYHLTVIMLRRPQLSVPGAFADGSWKRQMLISYASAKAMCRLQQGIFKQFGLPGLMCMQRGINFVIYAVLTCALIHLVAITSPDPELNTDARDYFARHMRILEQCMEAWPMPEMQMQVNQLREAFSADVNRPFELKRGFPFESPSPSAGGLQPSPPLDTNIQHPMLTRHESLGHQTQMPYHTAPITPPISSAGLSFEDSKDGLLMSGSMQMMASSQQQSMPMHTTPMSIGQEWNPTPIIAQWNNAFGPAADSTVQSNISIPQQSPQMYTPSSSSQPSHTFYQQPASYPVHSSMPSLSRHQTAPQLPVYTAPAPSFVTSSMWRDTVASTYDPAGNKRRWDLEENGTFQMDNPIQKKRSK
ncbi:hypothetical protein HO173_008364 [Letharia columbiana]|uniref:Zn(2)-C6 fungal-type domain-containing protein n=1 Tax=Letharia columbiana TaxID=112416 RepID=A0A8H6L2V2_9LECA|nr:uncharacterized protein HO173_008364 [Letharia columbiana]KAF6233432.1 hypothetical protein HO173_008364 [Letharia columbiana]